MDGKQDTQNLDKHVRAVAAAIPAMVSLKTLARRLDAHRYSVQRWLTEAGIRPLALGRGQKGAIRYNLADVQGWLQKRVRVTYPPKNVRNSEIT